MASDTRPISLATGRQAPPQPRSARLPALDGLRGLAALIVLVHHSLLTVPAFAIPYLSRRETTDTVPWLMTYTPLHWVWEGHAAVYVFFVLSGLVLTLPVVGKGRAFDWLAYYPQRLIRLYVPVWAAVVLAVGFFVLVPRDPTMQSLWLQYLPHELRSIAVVKDMTLLNGNGKLLSPLWSLRWEIIFSLLFPLFAFVAIRMRRWRIPIALACLVVTGWGKWADDTAATYLPMFLLGCLMATAVPELRRLGERLGPLAQTAVVGGGIVLATAPWLPGLRAFADPLVGVAAAGAALLVFAAIAIPTVERMLSTPVMRWFGLVSFSLYLVHEPIVVASAHFFGEGQQWLAIPVGMVCAVAVATLFHRVVEVPSHRLARAAGAGVRRLRGR